MAMVFPTSPTVGQVFTSGGRSWVWNGSTWDSPRTDNLQNIPSLVGGNTFEGVQTFTTPIGVGSGGTGVATLASGGYLKGAGTSAVTSQSGIPAGDITSGTFSKARMPVGSVLQVVSALKTDQFSTASTTYVDITGLSTSITPNSASNKVLVTVSVSIAHSGSDTNYAACRLVRGATSIGNNANDWFVRQTTSTVRNDPATFAYSFLDSPATTSATTYKVQMRANAGTAYLSRGGNNTDTAAVASITVQEVVG
jgi:hypothetical protein